MDLHLKNCRENLGIDLVSSDKWQIQRGPRRQNFTHCTIEKRSPQLFSRVSKAPFGTSKPPKPPATALFFMVPQVPFSTSKPPKRPATAFFDGFEDVLWHLFNSPEPSATAFAGFRRRHALQRLRHSFLEGLDAAVWHPKPSQRSAIAWGFEGAVWHLRTSQTLRRSFFLRFRRCCSAPSNPPKPRHSLFPGFRRCFFAPSNLPNQMVTMTTWVEERDLAVVTGVDPSEKTLKFGNPLRLPNLNVAVTVGPFL